ncbi:MAG: type II toxin-antitoxin system RelE/ParE family toxin [bacterium]
MIKSFADKMTSDIFDGINSRQARKFPNQLIKKARRLLDQINASPSVEMLKIPPGNKLEKLSGKLKKHWSMRINDQWRVIFEWHHQDALNVQIIDYHK